MRNAPAELTRWRRAAALLAVLLVAALAALAAEQGRPKAALPEPRDAPLIQRAVGRSAAAQHVSAEVVRRETSPRIVRTYRDVCVELSAARGARVADSRTCFDRRSGEAIEDLIVGAF
jgi:hypothetical protein